jgi:hypothetical protein
LVLRSNSIHKYNIPIDSTKFHVEEKQQYEQLHISYFLFRNALTTIKAWVKSKPIPESGVNNQKTESGMAAILIYDSWPDYGLPITGSQCRINLLRAPVAPRKAARMLHFEP